MYIYDITRSGKMKKYRNNLFYRIENIPFNNNHYFMYHKYSIN